MPSDGDAGRIAASLGKPQRRGKGWRCLCPAHDDSSPSLDIDEPSPGRLLFVCRAGCDQPAIIAALRARGLWPPPAWPVYAAPQAASQPRHKTLGSPTATYRYYRADGALAGLVARWDRSGEPKSILPAIPADRGNGWQWKAMSAPRPLYRLPELVASADDGRQVLVVAGEKCADAAAKLLPDLAVTTWAGGEARSSKAIERADWTSLAGRSVVLWPDADPTGDTAMAEIAGILTKIGVKSLKVIRVSDRPLHWDIADAILEDKWTTEQILEFAKSRAEAWISNGHAAAKDKRPAQPVAQVIHLDSARPKPQPAAPPTFSDSHLAHEFTRRHGREIRYVAVWNKWFRWTGQLWAEEKTLLAFDLARTIADEAAASVEDAGAKGAKAIASAKTVAAIAELARKDRVHATTETVWDTDPWLLNTPSGTIDLSTGQQTKHNPDDHLTKMTGVAPDDACKTPIWDEFLKTITRGDEDLQAFLKRISGYSLTGDTREHAMFFLWGTGGNGKGTFVNALTGCIGDYARTTPIETFTESKGDRHPTEIAALRGARMVTAQETEEGRRWAESRIKALTGGDKLAARFMRQDFFEFTPQFKLIIAGNHKPGLRSVDEAIRRRFHLVPFTANIPAAEKDLELGERLKAEWPGILSWMIDGCAEWQECGLAAPECVTSATAAYLEAEDAISAWIDDKCERTGADTIAALFASWKAWAEANGEFVGSSKRFSQSLEERGFERMRSKTSRMYAGLHVVQSEPTQSHWNY